MGNSNLGTSLWQFCLGNQTWAILFWQFNLAIQLGNSTWHFNLAIHINDCICRYNSGWANSNQLFLQISGLSLRFLQRFCIFTQRSLRFLQRFFCIFQSTIFAIFAAFLLHFAINDLCDFCSVSFAATTTIKLATCNNNQLSTTINLQHPKYPHAPLCGNRSGQPKLYLDHLRSVEWRFCNIPEVSTRTVVWQSSGTIHRHVSLLV